MKIALLAEENIELAVLLGRTPKDVVKTSQIIHQTPNYDANAKRNGERMVEDNQTQHIQTNI